MLRKITIVKCERRSKDLNDDLQWVSRCLGMFGERDREKSCYRIFVELVKEKKGLTSDEIALKSNLTRGTVVHHLMRLIDSGAVVSYKNKYLLRAESLKELVNEMERDILSVFKDLERVSEEVDKELTCP